MHSLGVFEIMISDDRLQKALTYLSQTDEEAANLKVELARTEYRCKLVRAQVFLESEGSVEAKKAKAEVSQLVQQAQEQEFKAMGAFEYVKAKRATEEWVVDIWRSIQANRRQGQMQ